MFDKERFNYFGLEINGFFIMITHNRELPNICDIEIYEKNECGDYKNSHTFREESVSLIKLLSILRDYN